MVKRRLPVIPRERNGGVCIALAGNYSRREAIHITLEILGAIERAIKIAGSVASMIALALYMRDNKN